MGFFNRHPPDICAGWKKNNIFSVLVMARVGVRYMYLYLGTVFQVPVSVPDPHEQEVPGPKYLKNRVHARYIYEIINIYIYLFSNIHTNQVSEF